MSGKTTGEEGGTFNAHLKQVEGAVFLYYQDLRAARESFTAEAFKMLIWVFQWRNSLLC